MIINFGTKFGSRYQSCCFQSNWVRELLPRLAARKNNSFIYITCRIFYDKRVFILNTPRLQAIVFTINFNSKAGVFTMTNAWSRVVKIKLDSFKSLSKNWQTKFIRFGIENYASTLTKLVISSFILRFYFLQIVFLLKFIFHLQ